MSKTLTIIPQSNHGLIAEISDNKVHIINKVDIPYNSISKIVDNKTIATLDKENKQLLFHAIDGSFIKSMDVPFGIAMNVKDSVVYVGGNARDGEVCYMVDLESEMQNLQNIELPVPMGWGKAVDDILIEGNKMMLVDDIVYPKYTFEYDISTPNEPVWVNTIDLPDRRAYENIIKGDMNEDWMIYLSSSNSGWTGKESHITIIGKKEIQISSLGDDSIIDICLVGDILYTLTDIGLGYFDLNDSDISIGSIVFIEHKIVAYRIIKINDKQFFLVNKYEYEHIDLENISYFDGGIKEKFWSYGSINLSGKNLEEFPADKIKDLERLEYLDLSNNKLEVFPEALRVCKQLRWLNLEFSGITKIPDWLEEFEHLEYLNISTIDIDSPGLFASSQIKFPKRLKYLNLRYCQINTIPPSVFELEDLEYLNLLENSIWRIPGKIKKLKKLKTLELRWENVFFVSSSIKELPLETIEFSAARGKFPKAVYLMPNLKRITATTAGIKRISSKIKNLTKLEYLDLEQNYDLKKLPENIGDLKNLKTLNLSVCGLKKLPKSICELTRLEALDLSSNKLTRLPENLGNLTRLKELNLNANKLKSLPESFQKLTQLKALELSQNRLKTLPEGISKLQKVKVAELWENRFNELPSGICELKYLTEITMFNNKLTTLPEGIGELSNLRELSLSENSIASLPEAIGKLKKLEKLSLGNNALTDLPDVLFGLVSLEELSLKDNQLKELPEQISQLLNLEELEIEGNEFATLPDSIVHLKHLKNISIPDYVFTLTSAQYDWIGEIQQYSNLLFQRLPLAPSAKMSIYERVLMEAKGATQPEVDDDIIKKLIKWANEKKIDELEWREPWYDGDDGSWDGFPRDKKLILRLKEINLLGARCEVLPKEIGLLTNLVKLNLGQNDLIELPEEITNLTNLSFINLGRNPDLKLTTVQRKWIVSLKAKDCIVWMDDEAMDC